MGYESKTNFVGLELKDVIPQRDKPWWRDGPLLLLNFLLLSALLTQTASGFDSSMINNMQSLPQWTAFFGSPKGTRLGAMTFGPTGGTLISILISAQLCDRLGRRWPIFLGSLVIIAGSAVQAGAVNYAMFVASRFLVGFGLGIVATAAPPLLSECAYPTHRGKLVSFYLVSWPLGSVVASWTTYGTFQMTGSSWSWRLPSLLQCTFSILQAGLVFFAPESPRWLIYQGRTAEAHAFFTKYHGDGDAESPLVKFEMAQIVATLEMEKEQQQTRWMSFFSTPGMRHRFFLAAYIPAMLQWSGNALITYYLTKVLQSIGIMDSKTQLIINGCISIWSLLVAAVFAALVDRLGRRRLFLLGTSGMCLSYVIWTVCSALNQEDNFENKGYADAVILMIFVYVMMYHLQSPIAPTYIMEIVPYALRSKASMMYQLTGNLAGLFNSFANPVAMEAITWKYYIVWCAVIAANFVLIYLYFPETKGRGLEEMAEIFDGPDALAGTNAMKKMGLDVNADKATNYAAGKDNHVANVEHMEA